MKGRWTATQLRANVYRILDQVLETGEPCESVRAEESCGSSARRECLAPGVTLDDLVNEPDVEQLR